jgi:hypothetical protein
MSLVGCQRRGPNQNSGHEKQGYQTFLHAVLLLALSLTQIVRPIDHGL